MREGYSLKVSQSRPGNTGMAGAETLYGNGSPRRLGGRGSAMDVVCPLLSCKRCATLLPPQHDPLVRIVCRGLHWRGWRANTTAEVFQSVAKKDSGV